MNVRGGPIFKFVDDGAGGLACGSHGLLGHAAGHAACHVGHDVDAALSLQNAMKRCCVRGQAQAEHAQQAEKTAHYTKARIPSI